MNLILDSSNGHSTGKELPDDSFPVLLDSELATKLESSYGAITGPDRGPGSLLFPVPRAVGQMLHHYWKKENATRSKVSGSGSSQQEGTTIKMSKSATEVKIPLRPLKLQNRQSPLKVPVSFSGKARLGSGHLTDYKKVSLLVLYYAPDIYHI